jgi:hypothetical protein
LHIAESYALQAGQRLQKPVLYDQFYPLPFSDYIVFQPISKPSKTYDFWLTVIEQLSPILEKSGIKIVQIGKADEPKFPFCYHAHGASLLQSMYLIRHSKLVLSADSWSAHAAGIMGNIPIVSLYSNNYVNCVKPYFASPEQLICLEPNRENLKPTFSFDEKPKQINKIKPEEIVRSVCSLLKLEFNFPFETIFIGNFFNVQTLEIIPNQVVGVNNPVPLTIRMDLEFNEAILFEHLKQYKCLILTKQPINFNLLSQAKANIIEVIYELDENHSSSFPDALRQMGINYRLISYLPTETINKLKLEYLDIGLINTLRPTQPAFMEINRNYYYKTSKFLIANGKTYPSLWAYKNDLSVPNMNESFNKFDKEKTPVEFYKEIESFQILIDKN